MSMIDDFIDIFDERVDAVDVWTRRKGVLIQRPLDRNARVT
jgi:hypothetical protein